MSMPSQEPRIQGRFWIEDAIIDRYAPHIGAIGVAVYAYLARRADRQGVCFPSYQTVAQRLNLSRRTVITYIRLLEQHGLLVAATRGATKGRRANAYRLVSLPSTENGAAVAPFPPADGPHNGAADSRFPPPDGPHNGAAVAPVQQDHQAGATGSPFAPSNRRHNGAAVAPVQQDHQGSATGSPFAPSIGRQNGATVALVQQDHQGSATGSPRAPANGRQNGAAVAPVQQDHQGSAADSPGVVQHDHQGGAAVAPEGNTLKESQEKESQRKEVENGTLQTDEVGPKAAPSLTSSPAADIEPALGEAATPSYSEPAADDEAAMAAALCLVTGKDLSLLREAKRREYTQAAARLRERGFTAEDVRDFDDYWRQAHPVGSKKSNAGYPHLVQVLEDLAGALPWIREQRCRQDQDDAWQEDVRGCLPDRAPKKEADQEACSLWNRIRDELILRLPTPAVQVDLYRAKPVSLADGALLVELPTNAVAEWWRLRLHRPVTDAVACVVDHPLTVTFTGPSV